MIHPLVFHCYCLIIGCLVRQRSPATTPDLCAPVLDALGARHQVLHGRQHAATVAEGGVHRELRRGGTPARRCSCSW